ncbi:MSC_0618 family F1-like ATPase beta subunit [Mycoplasmopsis pulmonis]|uniref:MSC_0618 family F1-like ATPase beta subunit n=1 Tax=Mycoplasmopsis pulmonis TaxID=2107 RepID=UPI002ACE4DFB|nr:FoF1 ATP synthase subunit beta [Mycoplasmopsis pulmonis]MDZ7293448.1 F0F1 ATP synthase subunit beta [Mycoplasmopsis pulmonis]
MKGIVVKIWTNVIQVKFEKSQQKPKVDQIILVGSENNVYMIKNIISEDEVRAILIKTSQRVFIGQVVLNTMKKLEVPVGKSSMNKVFDILGNCLNDKSAKNLLKVEIDSTITKSKNLEIKNEILETGIKAIDFFIPILRGSKLGILGGAGVGKTVVMKEIIFNASKFKAPQAQKEKKNTSSIFIGSGERSREGLELYDELQNSKLLDKTVMFISQMNEAPGARMSIVPVGITAAEYLRDREKENVLLFIDNIYRFVQASSEVSATLGKKPSLGGYQPTLDTEVSFVHDRLFLNANGSITTFETVFLPMDDLTDPSAVSIFSHLDSSMVLSRDQAAKNIYPAFDPLASSSSSVNEKIIGTRHFQAILETKNILQKYQELEDIISILGFDELEEDSKIIVKKAFQLQNFFTQRFFTAENFTKEKGVYVPLNETIESVIRILEGKYLKQSPEIFSFVGSNLNIPTDEELGL